MTGLLAHTDAARREIAAATTVLAAKGLRDKAEAIRQYGIAAKDERLERAAVEFKLRAERRLGELLAEMKASGRINKAHVAGARHDPKKTTLADAGISRDLSSRAQRIAKVPERRFEEALAACPLAPRLKLTPLNGKPSRSGKSSSFDFHAALGRIHDMLAEVYDASTPFQREQLLSDLRAFLNTIGSTKQ